MKEIDNYEYNSKEDFLGKGSFGNVYKGRNKQTKEEVAIKFVNMTQFNDQYMLLSLKKEIDVMKQLKHENVVKLLDVFGDPKTTIMIIELCDGDLRRLMRQHHNQILQEDLALNILKQFMKGYQELYRKGYIHRDIKPENVLYRDGCYKIADFGFATNAKEGQHEKLFKESVGTPLYMAPQLLLKQVYTSKCDIWSIGILAYEMVYGKQPWPCRDKYSYIQNIKKQPLKFPIDIKVSDEYQDFITKCLQIDEKQRFSWDELFAHDILNDLNDKRNYKLMEINIDKQGQAILARIQKIIQNKGLDLKEQFQKFDQDQGGSLDFKEFFQFVIQLDASLTGKEIKLLFSKIDQDQSKTISMDEFKKIFCQYDYLNESPGDRIITDLKEIIKANKQNLNKIFAQYDQDHQGDLSKSEFTQMIRHEIAKDIRDYDIEQMFKKFDVDDDQRINIDEFRNILDPGRGIDRIETRLIEKFIEEFQNLIKDGNLEKELIFKNFAKNQLDVMNFNEFSKLCGVVDRTLTEIERRQIFKYVNLDDQDGITLSEFKQIFE